MPDGMIGGMSTMTVNAPLFSDIEPRSKRLPLRILLLAVVLHALLLGISRDEKPFSTPVLEVALKFEPAENIIAPKPEPEILPRPEILPEPATQTPVEPPAPPTPAEATPGLPPTPADAVQKPPPPALNRVELLESIARMDWTVPDGNSELKPGQATALARPTSSEIISQLYRPIVAMNSNAFDGMTAPRQTEVMDTWLEPGGAHRVVIRAPNGETYCGRQEPMDDFRPWLQMPMMFHSCGGGGKRSGKQGWRNN